MASANHFFTTSVVVVLFLSSKMKSNDNNFNCIVVISYGKISSNIEDDIQAISLIRVPMTGTGYLKGAV